MTPKRFRELSASVREVIPPWVLESEPEFIHGDLWLDHMIGLRGGSIGSINFSGDRIVTPMTDEQIVQRIGLLKAASDDREQLGNLIRTMVKETARFIDRR